MAVSVCRTVILYFLILLSMRLMGKRQLGELQPSELVVTLLLSDLAAVPMQENSLPLLEGVLPILTLVALEILLSCGMMRFQGLSKLIAGSPIVVIRDGKWDEKAMRRLRLTVDDLLESLRQQRIFDPSTVQYAIAETGGKITAYCYPPYRPVLAGEVCKDLKDEGMPTVIISDGVLSSWGLSLCGLDETWLKNTLKKRRVTMDEVFLLTASKTGVGFLLTKQEAQGGRGK